VSKKILKFLLIYFSIFSANVNAATWYGFSHAWTDNVSPYFDKDTIIKSNGTITLWIKWVFNPVIKRTDGVYAYAEKVTYICGSKKHQRLFSSEYDSNNEFLRSYPKPRDPEDIIPGSLGEDISKIICTPSFPQLIPNEAAYKLEGVGVIDDARIFYEKRAAAKNDPAPK
jgi:hypothetical protein